jgi:hypothetical protein
MPSDIKVSLIFSPRDMAERRGVTLECVFCETGGISCSSNDDVVALWSLWLYNKRNISPLRLTQKGASGHEGCHFVGTVAGVKEKLKCPLL